MTTRYSPELNGVSECLNQMLLDIAYAILFDAKLPNKLWPQAIFTALYVKNRLLYSSISLDTTLYEM